MRKYRSTLFFAIVVIGVTYFAYFDTQKSEREEMRKEVASKVFGNLEFANINQIKIVGGDKTIVAKKDSDGKWAILEPVIAAADSDRIEGLVTAILRESATPLNVERSVNWADYGLTKPKFTIEFSATDGAVHSVQVSSTESFDGKYFLRKGQADQLYLGESTWKSHGDKDVKNLRSRKVFQDEIDVASIRLKKGPKIKGQGLEFNKASEDNWTVVGQESLKIEQTMVNSLLRNLQSLEATDFVTEEKSQNSLKKYGLAKPHVEIEVVAKGEQSSSPVEVKFSAENDNNVYVTTSLSPVIFQLAKTKLNLFDKGLADFRDKKYPFSFDKNQVAEFRYKDENHDIHLKKVGEDWQQVKPDANKQVNQDRVTRLIRNVHQFRVEDYLTQDKDKVLADEGKFIEFSSDKGILLRFVWGKALPKTNKSSAENFYAKSSLSPELFSVGGIRLKDLPVDEIIEDKKDEKEPEKPTKVSKTGK